MSPGYDLCPSVSNVVPVFTLARTNASIEAAELSGIAARRIRPDRVSRYFARFRLGLAWLVPRSMTSTAPAIRIFPDFTGSKKLLSARNGTSAWSTSTTPSSGSRCGSIIDRRSFCASNQAVLYVMPSWASSWTADRSREIREDPYRWRCRGHRPRHQPGQAKAEKSEIPGYSVWTYPSRRYPGQLRGFDRGFCAGQREDRNDAAHRRAQILSRAHRLPTRPADGRQDGRPYRTALDSSSLRADEALGARHLPWAAPQAHRHVSQRVCLPVQSALLPARLVRNLARARLAPSPDELLGYRRARQSPQRRADSPAPAAAPKNSDRNAGRRIKTRKIRTPPRFGFDPPALDIDQPGTTG